MSYLIYKITNIANDKIYVGKTKEFYGDQYFGIEGRLRQHLVNAFTNSKKNDCPRLYNAIRKYGKESFIIELLEKTDELNVDRNEIFYIDVFGSTDEEIGYNIALGGGGRSVVEINENIREKISKAQTKDGLMNIKPYYNDNNIQTGYFARRREQGKVYQKYFTSTKFTIEENLEQAKQWIESIKTNKNDTSTKYNKTSNLPKNINYIKDRVDKDLVIGYRVDICQDGVKYIRSFQLKNGDLNKLLNEAVKYKNSILNKN